MLMLRWCSMFLALAVVSATGQQPANPAPAASANDAQNAPGMPLHVGGAVQKPIPIHIVYPDYSDEAREAKFSGTVVVYLQVDKNGDPSHVRVVKGVGMGLDEKAVEAVRQYKFKPATLNGEPVTVDLYINVNFQIFQGVSPLRSR
jgi:periplasmic protein TonB